MAKKMVINCASCDARQVSEETLQKYEHITINAADVLVSPRSRELLNQYPVKMNCANVVLIDEDVHVCRVNGGATLRAEDVIGEKRYYMVNGSLTIESVSDEMMERIVGMSINGSVTMPESLSGKLPMTVNGSTICYPDGAVVLKRNAVIDRVFALRAKERLYWAKKRMIMVDPELDAKRLANRGARFSAPEVILTEELTEAMVDLIDEKAELIIVPDGTSVVLDDVELDEMTVKKYGTKLYIIGDLDLTGDEADVLEKLKYLWVRGDVKVTQERKMLLMEKLTGISGKISVPISRAQRVIGDKISLRVTRWMLEQEAIHVEDCMTVKIDEDIPKELILERLTISDVLTVKCAPEQEDVLAMVCEDVMTIGEGDGEDNGIGGMIKETLGGVGDLLNTKMVNAADYVM